VIDEANPHRSAVVLAGAGGEDGLLQVPEIAQLGLTGQAVILSTCNSAKGKLVGGEGNLSLSRAFLQAGARAVLGNLWRVRDEEGLAFVARLGQELADGKSVGQAYHATQRAWIREGKPAAAWAGFVLLGDGDLTPFQAAGNQSLLPPVLVAGLVLLLLLGLVLTRRKTTGR
jgi:CHAT domain-containing protein